MTIRGTISLTKNPQWKVMQKDAIAWNKLKAWLESQPDIYKMENMECVNTISYIALKGKINEVRGKT